MADQFEYINATHIHQALQLIDRNGIPDDHKRSLYFIQFKNALYPFKYSVELASGLAGKEIRTVEFTSSESAREYIASLDFRIIYKDTKDHGPVNYYVGAHDYGLPDNKVDMLDTFRKEKIWGTDHAKTSPEGKRIFSMLQHVKINDRICLRYYGRRNSRIYVSAYGTVSGTSEIANGKLNVNWDYNSKPYDGQRPMGIGSGNWWSSFFQLKRKEDIELIFGESKNERRVSRVTFNTEGWMFPSGRNGKSTNAELHEGIYGYGHEEWLFDISKLIDGYHYGFIGVLFSRFSKTMQG